MDLFDHDDPRLLEKLEELEKDGEDYTPSTSKPSWTYLHWFAAKNEANFVSAQAHVLRGDDPSAQDDVGDTPLHIATWRESDEKVAFLLKLGAQTNIANDKGNVPCHQALRKRNLPLALALVDGIDVGMPDRSGVSAIGHAVECLRVRQDLFPCGTPEARLWAILREADRAAWTKWEDQLPQIFLADLRQHRLNQLEEGLDPAALKKPKPRL